jgi:arabinan endo-1,5-alpha-L-arabinosidase
MKNYLFFLFFTLPVLNTYAQPLQTNISVHDPVIIKQDSSYYIFCTGFGISVFSSTDMKNWKTEKPVFDKAPQWADLKDIFGRRISAITMANIFCIMQ